MIWFTSDLHLGHRTAISTCERPFETVEEMNEMLINNFNQCVKKNDTIYILGDIAHRTPVADVNQLISRLNGKKILCKGNHDKNMIRNCLQEYMKSRHGSLHLHGHIHSKGDYNLEQREAGILRYDIGVDANNYCPVSIEQIEFFIGTK